MRQKIDFELIDKLLYYLRQKYEEDYDKVPENTKEKLKAKEKLLNQHIWLKQYIKVENYLKANPEINPNDIKNDDFNESFNPKSWMASQRSLETRGILSMERRHLLSLMGIVLKETSYDDYVPFMKEEPLIAKKPDEFKGHKKGKVKRLIKKFLN